MQRVVIEDHSVLPVLTLNDRGIQSTTPDGAYYMVMGEKAQIVVVGPMHFTPGQYLEALNTLMDEGFEHDCNSFLVPPSNTERQNVVLHRGFVDLRFRK